MALFERVITRWCPLCHVLVMFVSCPLCDVLVTFAVWFSLTFL